MKEKSPLPPLTENWLNKRFPNSAEKIRVVPGLGENRKKPKLNCVTVTVCHANLEVIQLKAFHRILLLKALADSEYSVDPVIYIGALRDIARGHQRGDIRERVVETSEFFKGVFSSKVRTIEDRVELQKDVYSVISILRFEKSLQNILDQIDTEEKLDGAKYIKLKEKEMRLTEYEKELLRIYLFRRRKLKTELQKYYYVSWGLEALDGLGASYSIFDKSNAGLSILRKLICAENDKEYPATIVLPDPITISGKPMRYVESKDLDNDETLFVCDSKRDVKLKIYEQEGVSLKFLDYLANNIVRSFAPSSVKNELDSKYDKMCEHAKSGDGTAYRQLKRIVFESYREFIKPYYNSIERIHGTHESLFVQDELLEKALDALGSERNREILKELASYYEKHETPMTVDELCEKLGLSRGAKKGLWRNVDKLVNSGLVNKIPEGKRLNKYCVYGNKTVIRIRWSLVKE